LIQLAPEIDTGVATGRRVLSRVEQHGSAAAADVEDALITAKCSSVKRTLRYGAG